MTVFRRQVDTPLGPAVIAARREGGASVLTGWSWGTHDGVSSDDPVLVEAERQVSEYFAGTRTVFDLPLAPAATPFQAGLRRAMMDIPFGAVRSYGDLARDIGSAPRAIGQGCGRNPLPVIVPCHRVVGQGGALVGYSLNGVPDQAGLSMKAALLNHEQKEIRL